MRVVELLNGLAGRWGPLDWLVTQVAEGFLWVIPLLAVVAVWAWRRRAEAAWGILAAGVGVAITDFLGARLKVAFERPRPCHVMESLRDLAGCGDAFSMPSNHMLNSAFVASFLQVLYPRSGWVLWPIVAFNAFGRLYLAAHFPSDVLVGTLLGAALGIAGAFVFRRWWRARVEGSTGGGRAAEGAI